MGKTGRCHRHAPRPSTPNELLDKPPKLGEIDNLWDESSVVWPITEEFDWCGEYKEGRDGVSN
jgi:hypothetical protein